MSRRRLFFFLLVAVAFLVAIGIPTKSQNSGQKVVADRNVNMVSGTQLPNGDPWLQRQNEPSIAVSTRNPLHLLAGSNDYRTIDMPGEPTDELPGQEEKKTAAARDAWLGVFKSFDGGQSWIASLLPGFPQDTSPEGQASPLWLPGGGYKAAADPVVRAGTNGLFYYSGIAFNRDTKEGVVFVARFIDNNNKENGDCIKYLDTKIIASAYEGVFIDKPWIAVDRPRLPIRKVTIDGQSIPRSNIYIAYSVFSGEGESLASKILFARSRDCGETWSNPIELSQGHYAYQGATIAVKPISGNVSVAWRKFGDLNQPNQAIYIAKSITRGLRFQNPVKVASFYSFDQGSSAVTFRTNSYPTMAVDHIGRLYLAWSQRMGGPEAEARIVITTSRFGYSWTNPTPIDTSGIGHQIMPSLTFAAGKLMMVWYDQRNDICDEPSCFTPYIADYEVPRRHTLDVRVAQADPARNPIFKDSIQISRYRWALTEDGSAIYQVQFNPVNFPLFKGGTWPFLGDYIDISPSPTFILNPYGYWRYNNRPTDRTIFHVAWTDNRDVRPPPDGNWTLYNPPFSDQEDPNFYTDNICNNWERTGMRNQNIYTSRITQGIMAGSPGNTKPLGTLGETPDGERIPRAFVVFVKNTTDQIKSFRLTIANQPQDGRASFLEFDLLYELDVEIAPRSSVSRSVFVDSSDPKASVRVDVAEIDAPYGELVPDGLESYILLNPEIENPEIENPEIENPEIENILLYEYHNPEIENPEIINWNYDILNPEIINPEIENPEIINPEIINPEIENPEIINPEIENANILNPEIENPSIVDPSAGEFTDVIWKIYNKGNTTSTYVFRTLSTAAEEDGTLPGGIQAQLLIYRVYTTPAEYGSSSDPCSLREQEHHELFLNIINPEIENPEIENPEIENPEIENPEIMNATFSLEPEGKAMVILRLWNPYSPPQSAARTLSTVKTLDYNSIINSINGYTSATSRNTLDLQQGITTYPTDASIFLITADPLADGEAGTPYSDFLTASGGTKPYTWSIIYGSLPDGLYLNSITGEIYSDPTPTTPGTSAFTVQVTDDEGQIRTRDFSITIRPSGGGEVLTITSPPTLPSGVVGSSYSTTLTAEHGTTPYTWSVVSGNLPDGLYLNSATGEIYSDPTPTTEGTFNFTIQVIDYSSPTQTASQAFSLYIALPPLTITTEELPPGIVDGVSGCGYYPSEPSPTLTATGGNPPYTWSLAGGNFPPGLTLTSDGKIIDIPQYEQGVTYPKEYMFTVQVTDSTAQTADKLLSITVDLPVLGIGTIGLPDGYIGQDPEYSATLIADCAIGDLTWIIVEGLGVLPPGLDLEASTGVISGTPQSDEVSYPYTYNFTVEVTDSVGSRTATRELSIRIAEPLEITTPSPLPYGIAGVSYGPVTLSATGGIQPYQWPPGPLGGTGLSIDSSGVISGTPTAGIFTFPIEVGDSASPPQLTSKMFTIVIHASAPPTGLVSWWSGDNNAFDYVNGNHGTLHYDVNYESGIFGQAFSFDDVGEPGEHDYISCPGTGIDTLQNALTVECWVKLNSGPSNRIERFVTIAPWGDEKAVLRHDGGNNPGQLHFFMRIGSVSLPHMHIRVDNVLQPGCFNHVVGTYDGTYMRLYLNGVEVGNLEALGGIATDGTDTGVNLSSKDEPLDGVLDEVRIYDRALNLSEIQAVYDSGGPEKCSPPVAVEITTISIPDGVKDTAYSTTLTATGGVAPLSWDLASGSDPLPDGLTLDSSTGEISGTPLESGYFNFTVEVTDAIAQTDTQDFSITIAEWVTRYNGPGNEQDYAQAIAVDSSGNAYVTGYSMGNGTGDDYATAKYDSSGAQLWVAKYDGGNGEDKALAIVVDSDKNVYVTGYSMGNGTGDDYATIKYNNNGSELWVARHNGPGNGEDRAQAIAVDSSGNVYVTGYSMGNGTEYDYCTVKYDSSGTQLWIARYHGEIGRDRAWAIAVDSDKNVYVTGESSGGPTETDYATVKYDSSGLQQWTARYDGTGNSWDSAGDIAVDSSGNVYVTGMSRGSETTSNDYATIKYDSDGNLAWEGTPGTHNGAARYNGPANGGDGAQAIAVDSSGNVYVIGISLGIDTSSDYATVKYDNSGTQLWVARYNGPANGGEFARAIAVDPEGNVYVTGHSDGGGTANDYATVKYDSSGQELWVARYNGPFNSHDMAYAIALDSLGNVYVTGGSAGSNVYGDFTTIKYTQSFPSSLIISTQTLDNGYAGVDYAATVWAFGGSGSRTWSITSGSLPPGLNLDTSTGIISGTPTTAGTYNFQVTVEDGALSDFKNLSITVLAAPVPTSLAFTQQPSGGVAGDNWVIQPVVVIKDQYESTVISDNTTEITLTIDNNPGDGTLSGTTTVTVSAGVATFANLSIDKASTGYTLEATSNPSYTAATSEGFDITHGDAYLLNFTQSPSGCTADEVWTQQPIVEVRDMYGNTVISDTSTQVTLAIDNNPSGGTLSGTTTVTVSAGVATFTDLSIDKAGTGYTLEATSAPSYTSTTSDAFDVNAKITGTLRYNGAPITNMTLEQLYFSVSKDGEYPTISVQYDDMSGEYTILNIPPGAGQVNLGVHIDAADPFDGLRFPGDFQGWVGSIPMGEDQSVIEQDINCLILIHITDPINNLLKVGPYPPEPYHEYTSPIFFQWDPIGEASIYRIKVDKYQHSPDFSLIENVYETYISNTQATINLDLSEPNEHYQFTVRAYKEMYGDWLGVLTIVYDSGAYGGDYRFRIIPGAASQVELTGPSSVEAGSISGEFTLTSKDSGGNPVNVTEDTVFNLSSDSGGIGTFYSDSGGTNQITQVTITIDTSSATFYYKDTKVGTPTVTAAWASGGADLGSDTHQITVEVGVGQIAFVSHRDGNNEIYVMNADGSGQANLTNNPADDSSPCWSPDRSKIAFHSLRDGNYEIYIMNADGSGQANLTNHSGIYDLYPCWSPDGNKIAFTSKRDGNYEIYVMNADGSGQTNLTDNPASDEYPCWSPDGSKIAFMSYRDNNWEIYVMNTDGSGQTNLTNNPGDDLSPRWSPDGSKIAFHSYRDENYEIYVMNADGSGQTRLTIDPADDMYPCWSPDGSKIAFMSYRDGNNEIYVMNADGTNQTNLTDNPASDAIPSWR